MRSHLNKPSLFEGALVTFSVEFAGSTKWIAHKTKRGWRFRYPDGMGTYKLLGYRTRIASVEVSQ